MKRLCSMLVAALLTWARWVDEAWDPVVAFVCHRWTRAAASWALALLIAALLMFDAWRCFQEPKRQDNGPGQGGNNGHTFIDFGGQWLMGAMLVHGHGEHLYDRGFQRTILADGYPREFEDPTAPKSDVERLMWCFMGHDAPETIGTFLLPLADDAPLSSLVLAAGCKLDDHDRPVSTEDQADPPPGPKDRSTWNPEALRQAESSGIGGPLYPPINAFIYAPLGALEPHVAYRLMQGLNLAWAFLAALGVRYMTRGRIWWPIAAALIMLYPGFKGSIHLGQNATLTLLIVVWGWALIVRDREVAAGLVWGLLAFKPVWAAAFFLVPFLTCRWRTCLAMLVMGAGLAMATVPFVGLQTWFDWLSVGREAAELYKTDANWVFLSRDLLGLPRRFLDFPVEITRREYAWANRAGWVLFCTCLFFTALLPLWRRKQAQETTGPVAAFLLLGAWLSCFHFMYYDTLLTVLPFFVLLADPRRLLEPILLAIVPLSRARLDSDFTAYYRPNVEHEHPPPVPQLEPGYRHIWVLNRMAPTLLLVMLAIEHILPRVGVAATLQGLWWDPADSIATTLKDGEVLAYRKVQQLGKIKLATSLYNDSQPWDTFCSLFLWSWCGMLWWLFLPRPSKEAKKRLETSSSFERIPVPSPDTT